MRKLPDEYELPHAMSTEEREEMSIIVFTITLLFILIWMCVLTMKLWRMEAPEPKTQESQEITIYISTEEHIEPSDDEITISIGHGEGEKIIKGEQK